MVSALINASFGWRVGVSLEAMLLSLLFCMVIGIFFGSWPARKAANLDPIAALRAD